MSYESLDAVAAAGEKETLSAFLDDQRELLLGKMEGASDEDLRKRLVPSLTTMLGVVKHLAYVERWWFQDRFLGRDVEYPWTDDDPDADFKVGPRETTEEILDLYRAECENSRAIVAETDLDRLASHKFKSGAGPPSLRWIVAHMIEETARHIGQVDILREQLDGATGYRW